MRFWRNTPNVSQLTGTQVWTGPADTIGYEWNEDLDNGARPRGCRPAFHQQRPERPAAHPRPRLDVRPGNRYPFPRLPQASERRARVQRRHHPVVVGSRRATTIVAGRPASPDMQQATVNLLADMGVQPATLDPQLVPASASTDVVAATSQITSPPNNAIVPVCAPHRPGHGRGHGAGTSGRRRGLGGRRADVASRGGGARVVLHVDADADRHVLGPHPRRRRQRQPRERRARGGRCGRLGAPAADRGGHGRAATPSGEPERRPGHRAGRQVPRLRRRPGDIRGSGSTRATTTPARTWDASGRARGRCSRRPPSPARRPPGGSRSCSTPPVPSPPTRPTSRPTTRRPATTSPPSRTSPPRA